MQYAMESIDLNEKFDLFQDHWNPRIVASLNGQDVKLVKVFGQFVWHSHAAEDELFFIVKGRLTMEFRDRKVDVEEGQMIVVPRGVEHRPIANEECWIMLFEPQQIDHTGGVDSPHRVEHCERI